MRTRYTLTFDCNTRTARALLVAIRIAVPMAAVNMAWNFLELPTAYAIMLGALVHWTMRTVRDLHRHQPSMRRSTSP